MLFKKKILFLFLFCLQIVSYSNFVKVIAQTDSNDKPLTKPPAKPPAPPPRIPPNKIQPGGGLELFKQSCSSNTKSLTALVPTENPTLAVNPYPTLLFYIPDAPSVIHHGKFSLVTADEKSTIYTQKIIFKNTPGIIKIQLPQSPEYALQKDRIYHWYLKLYCQEDPTFQTYLDVNGWIKKVDSTPENIKQIASASPQIWYDSLATVAANLAISPDSFVLKQQWVNLLREIDLEHLAQTSILELEPQ